MGRRESEPHSEAIFYLVDVLRTNFPDDRVFPDLNHYFPVNETRVPIQPDVSFFRNFKLDTALTSYKAVDHDGRIPDVIFNVLSHHTWKCDVGVNFDKWRRVGIPHYVLFAPYHVARREYRPPFLRVYSLQADGAVTVREACGEEGKPEVTATHLIDLTPDLPFRLGLLRSPKKIGAEPTFLLAPVHPNEPCVFQRAVDKQRTRAEKERTRAEKERLRRKTLEARLAAYKEKFGELGLDEDSN